MTILTITATKPSQESKLGVAFTRSGVDSPLMIKSVKPDSIFANTDLKAGMIVHEVLGEPMTWKTPKNAADALRVADAGSVTVSVQVAIGEIVKESKTAKLGIALKNSTTKPGIFVSKVNEDGAFANSELGPGMKVLYINDEPCPNDTKKAIALVKEAPSTLKIIAIPTDLVPPAGASTPKPITEEKKEDHAEESRDKAAAVVDEDDPEASKGIIDKIFATCIC